MSDLEDRIAKLSPDKRALLTLRLQKQRAATATQQRIPLRSNPSDPAPLSFSQQRLWFLTQMEPNNPFYTIPAAVRLTGTLDVSALELSLKEILRRHSILRTRFTVQDGEPSQSISPDLAFDLPIIDLREIAASEREREALRIARESACQSFDLSSGTLIRPLLIRLDEKDHILVLAMHHIVSDGWSLGVLVRELAACYPAFLGGNAPHQPDLPIQYADFAVWQRSWMQGQTLEEQLGDWKQQLAGMPTVLELPSVFPRPALQSYQGAREPFEFPASLNAALQSLARQEGATLFMALLAGFELLISRYSGQAEFCLGTPIANRTRPETEDLVGFFVNTLVIRARLDGSPSYRELLRRVRTTTLRAYAHQDLPFEMLVEALQPPRDMSHSPLFQIMFAMQNEPIPPLNLPFLEVQPLEIDPGTSRFDLTLSIYEQAGRLAGFIEYSTDLFDREYIQDFLSHYQRLLEEVNAHPDEPVFHLNLLTPAEKRQLQAWNDTQVDLPPLLIQQIFEDQVRQHPQAPALVFGDLAISYAELNQKANQLARWLIRRGVVPETLVPIYLERSFERVIAILGVLKAGGAYLPIDPVYPRERVAFMLLDSGAQILLTQSSLLEELDGVPITTFCMDRGWAEAALEDSGDFPCLASLDNLAYVIYTSGTTGKPKGVLLQHRGVVNLVLPQLEVLQAKPGTRMLQFASFTFDASVLEIFTMLSCGGTLVLAPQDVVASTQGLIALLADQEVNLVSLPPSLLAVLPVTPLPRLTTLIAGGEACPAEVVRRWGAGRRFINAYGPTETTVVASLMLCNPEESGAPPIGRPISNTRLYVLDPHRQPVPVGIPGELWIGGLGVARGYLRRPELTQEKFLLDPFSEVSGARMYASGDFVRQRRDGCIEYIGRIDHQVKIRGYRIELGEIESQLELQPGIRQAAVLAREDIPGDKRLIAYLIPEESYPQPTSAELRSFLKQTLPDYMIPSGYIFLDSMPLTASGKIDRGRLPAPAWSNLLEESQNCPPRTPTEEILSGIWGRILGIQGSIGAFSNFFELGGHSLLASQVITRVRDAFQIDLPIRALFEAPILTDFAQKIDIALQDESLRTDAAPIQHLDRRIELPLSFAQQRLWFLNHLEPDNPSYNLFSALRITGELDVPRFQASLERIVQRHEILRTSFQTVDGRAVQVIAEEARLPFELVDLSGVPDQLRQEAIERRIKTEPFIPFDLTQAPLLRVTLLQIAAEEHIALFAMHHIVSDGWSNNVLVQDLKSFYTQQVSGQEQNPPDLPIQYVDYAVWQREWLQGSRLEKIAGYWKQQLAGIPHLLELPTSRPRPPVQTSAGANLKFTFPEPLTRLLRSFAQREGATLFMALLAGFETLLYRYSAQDDFCIGTPVANRNRSEVEGLVGLFVNTLALRADLKGQPTFRELIHRVREICLGAYAHQEMPFEKLLDTLQIERSLSYNPIFQVMFVLQNNNRAELELPGVKLEWMDLDPGIAMFDLSLAVEETPSGLQGNFEYNTDLFDPSFIEGIVAHYLRLLEHALSEPETAITRLNLLSAEEEQMILNEWNQTRWDTPLLNLTVHQLFEAQVARTPEAPAVFSIAEGSSFSYQDLNRRANQLARRLRGAGIGPESIVGLCLDRSLVMSVALLGILKSGAAFLPLDWNYPQERLAFMLSETSAALILTCEKFIGIFSDATCSVHCLDTDWESIAGENDTDLEPLAGPENLAYVQYTSGSTGVPKGVLVSQRSLVNHNLSAARLFSLTPADRVLQFSTLNFDTALEEIFPAWISGASIILRPAGELPATNDLLDWVATYGITVLDLPTAYWHEWVSEMGTTHHPLPACLRLVIVGGEKAYPEKLAAWEGSVGTYPLWMNTYGPTEGTIIASFYIPEANVTRRPVHSLPIGRPLPNIALYILDPLLKPVPVGVTGELYIGGVGVARGYLNRPELNAEKFLADPFSSTPGGRMFRTGDLARWLPDGNVEYTGRQDDQVKIRGFRVEPGEIVAALLQYPDVAEAAVLPYEDAPGLRRLAAYIVILDGSNPTPADLREFLKARLPDYMIPAAFHFLPALPLTPTGKLDRKALPSAVSTRPALNVPLAEATSPEEAALVTVWKQVLGLDQIGIHDNFFELGGDSILSIQVVARARQVGLHLSPRLLFEYPTIASLAHAISTSPLVEAEQGTVSGPVPLSPVQRWFFDQQMADPHHWNQSVLLKVDHPLDPKALSRAAQALLDHHDALRTIFNLAPDGTWEASLPADLDAAPIVYEDFSPLDPETRQHLLDLSLQRCQASFQLSTGPLFRIAFFWLGNEQGGRILLCAHHLVIDTVSWQILLEDLFTCLVQISAGQAILLPAKTTSFQRWSSRLPDFAAQEAILGSLPFWQQLASFPANSLPFDFPQGSNFEADGATISISLAPEDTHLFLRDAPGAYHAEPRLLLLTALARALQSWAGPGCYQVEMEGHGREDIAADIDISRTVGWFTSLFPMLLDLRSSPSLDQILLSFKHYFHELPVQGLSYGLLRNFHPDPAVRERLGQIYHPQFSFNYLGQIDIKDTKYEDPTFALAQENPGPEHSPAVERVCPLIVTAAVVSNSLRINFSYSRGQFLAETIARFSSDCYYSLLDLLRNTSRATALTPEDFQDVDLSQEELESILREVGGTV
ncbi:MAG TPA: amino acid adenylation domain-containing protein [Anaerolineaceae bacterium]|nr:amino acid adenylation domain-containing protein [Anaerolineaceae bacterium]